MDGSKPEIVEHRDTSCFTYEINMIVQVLAEDKKEADDKLDREGGFVTQRAIRFVDKVDLYSGQKTEEIDE